MFARYGNSACYIDDNFAPHYSQDEFSSSFFALHSYLSVQALEVSTLKQCAFKKVFFADTLLLSTAFCLLTPCKNNQFLPDQNDPLFPLKNW
jgi:hypothetical protein